MTSTPDPLIEELLRLSRADQQVLSCKVDDSILGFHAQQAVEKALKALLTHLGISYGRTHDLDELQELVIKSGTRLPVTPIPLDRLTDFAVMYRYERLEDFVYDKAAVAETVAIILNFVAQTVGLSG
jgi:HEPN domain-containing protein